MHATMHATIIMGFPFPTTLLPQVIPFPGGQLYLHRSQERIQIVFFLVLFIIPQFLQVI